MANFKPTSRYNNGQFTLNPEDESFLILRQNLEIAESPEDVYFTVTQDVVGRPDLIAEIVYGEPELYWAIMDINNIRQPMFDLTVGLELRIPPRRLVLEALNRLNRVRR